jgi:imidazoleglycerol phosphate dehydratase HisB
MRKGSIKRNSKETQIQVALTIEGHGRYRVSTGIRLHTMEGST